jgi:hypothetical protein
MAAVLLGTGDIAKYLIDTVIENLSAVTKRQELFIYFCTA